jgi:hypothetical protein
MGLSSPSLAEQDEQSPYGASNYDSPETVALREQLNSVIPYQPTMPPVFQHWVRSYGPGVGDENYNVGYHQVPVGNQVKPLIPGYEAPNIAWRHLPYYAQIYGSTMFYQQSQNELQYPNLRAPAINEGY